jgi:hypothetical protein
LQGRLWTPDVWKGTAKLAAWWSPDWGVTTATGVSTLLDQSGNGRTAAQGTGGLQPAYSELGWRTPTTVKTCLTASGTQFLAFTGFVLTSVACVAEQDGGSLTSRALISGNTGAGELRISDTNTLYAVRTFQAGIQLGTITISTGLHVMGMDAISSTTSLWLNGVEETQTGTAPGFGNSVSILNDTNSGVTAYRGRAGEFVAAQTAVWDRRERGLVDGYLAWRWGTVGNLTASHPFKNRPPLIGD